MKPQEPTLQNALLPRVFARGQFVIPLWMPFLLFAGAAVFFGGTATFPPGHCRHCGYNLAGNISGVCPECGKRVTRSARSLGS